MAPAAGFKRQARTVAAEVLLEIHGGGGGGGDDGQHWDAWLR